ncbi:MAG: transposase [Kofleriaceae bacterium]
MVNQLYWYCLGWAAQKHDIVLHAAVAMSNHSHIVATDSKGAYPNFLRDFHAMLARAVNAHRGRWEHFWDSAQTSVVLLEEGAEQIEKLVYVLTNPLGLVEKAHHWPGATSINETVNGTTMIVARPPQFFRDPMFGGIMPETITLAFVPPPAFTGMEPAAYAILVRERIAARESYAAAERAENRTRVLGRKAVREQRWNDRPRDAEPRRNMSPTVACRDKWRRIELLLVNRAFRVLYRKAFEAFRRGLPAVFPPGTWRMRWFAVIEVGAA